MYQTVILIDGKILGFIEDVVYGNQSKNQHNEANHKLIENFIIKELKWFGLDNIYNHDVDMHYIPNKDNEYMGRLIIKDKMFIVKAMHISNLCLNGSYILQSMFKKP